jgi:protein gp138
MSGPAFGQSNASSDTSDYNAMDFIIAAALANMQTVSVVKVVAVHGGGVGPTGTVDVQVIVNLLTGNGQAVRHDIIYDVPFNRMQGGVNAIICDPSVGDVGMAAFASRDITSVKNSRGQANPSSNRTFDWADAIYVSGMLNGTPTQYILFGLSGIEIVSPTALTITAPTVTVNASTSVTVNAPTVTLGEATKIDGVEFLTHTHSGVQTGADASGPVVP